MLEMQSSHRTSAYFQKQKEQKASQCYHKKQSSLGEQEPQGATAPEMAEELCCFTAAVDLASEFTWVLNIWESLFSHQPFLWEECHNCSTAHI